MLAGYSIGGATPDFVDLEFIGPLLPGMSALGPHSYAGGDVNAQLYSCTLGFVDLGHLRDCADHTFLYYKWLQKKNKVGDVFPTHGESGTVKIVANVPVAQRKAVAANIAYDQALFHEIWSYWVPSPGAHNSGFSPEDLVSNFVGTFVGYTALEQLLPPHSKYGGSWDTAVTAELDAVLQLVKVVPKASARAAFGQIVGRWVSGSVSSNNYLKRRNFEHALPSQWYVPNLADCTNQTPPTPPALNQWWQQPPAGRSYYEAEFDVPYYGALFVPFSSLKVADFPSKITDIEADAQSKYSPGSNDYKND